MDVIASRAASVLFLSNYYPPEANALAARTSEHARVWIELGGRVTVIAGPPHFPEGRVYPGFENRFSRECIDRVEVLRVPMYVAPNEGFTRRTLSYFSYLLSSLRYCKQTNGEPDVVVASTPQFFAGLAGWLVSGLLRRPFVLEVRDLWPESIVAVGAMKHGRVVRLLERLEGLLYRAADHIVVVSPAFVDHVADTGVERGRISVLPNGVDVSWLERSIPENEIHKLRAELELEGRFVASYIGTVGMAHGVEIMLEAAARCENPEIAFLIVGGGAEIERLRIEAAQRRLGNVRVVEKQPRSRIPLFYGLSDVSVVHLRRRPAFRKVIPSKMFESMAAQLPIVLGVEGEACRILETAEAGIPIPPEDANALLEAITCLAADPELRTALGRAGATFVRKHYDRRVLAERYWQILRDVAASK